MSTLIFLAEAFLVILIIIGLFTMTREFLWFVQDFRARFNAGRLKAIQEREKDKP